MSYDNRDCLYPGQHGDFCRCRWAIGREKGEVVLEGNSPLGPLDRARRVPAPLVAPEEAKGLDLERIRERHRFATEHAIMDRGLWVQAHSDRAALIAEIERLRTPEEAERLEVSYQCGTLIPWLEKVAAGSEVVALDIYPEGARNLLAALRANREEAERSMSDAEFRRAVGDESHVEAERSSPEPVAWMNVGERDDLPVFFRDEVEARAYDASVYATPRADRIVPLYRRTPVEPAR